MNAVDGALPAVPSTSVMVGSDPSETRFAPPNTRFAGNRRLS
jgi:hypothetical protein